jgi:eukaryotic-like serine/threonine-protein kinase
MDDAPDYPEDRKVQPQPGYDYVQEIARGGYGCVYLFSREWNGQRDYVAGKFVYRGLFGPSDDSSSAAAYERVLEGLQNFRSLTHQSPYLLRIFDVRERHEEGYFCYMMELADDLETRRRIDPGVYRPKTLRNELERGGRRHRLPGMRCVDVAIMLARGLRVLHESGFTHRDVRPSNIIFVNELPKLADIDLLAGSDETLPSYIPQAYAAPEGSHSCRADIFSFGKTLYEMSTGLPVAAYPTLPPDLRFWADHRVMLDINRVIARACARDPGRRYDSVSSMLDDLELIRQGTHATPRLPAWLRSIWP